MWSSVRTRVAALTDSGKRGSYERLKIVLQIHFVFGNRSPWHGGQRVAGGLRGGVEEGRDRLAAVCGVARRGEVVEDVSVAEA